MSRRTKFSIPQRNTVHLPNENESLTPMRHFNTHNKHTNVISHCTNCGQLGHILRNCLSPITSYGIIAVRSSPEIPTIQQKLCSTRVLLTGMERSNEYQFLLIQRRDSLSFIEFIRGKYNISDSEYISRLLRAMTKKEHEKLRTKTFEDIWKSVWGETSMSHRTDFDNSEKKYKILLGEDKKGIQKLLDENPTEWTEPEWGFPKGRRNPHETDAHCAIREFQEETNIDRKDFELIHNIQPLTETFFGSNQVHYCHKYYLAFCKSDLHVSLTADNPHMTREIGDIRWLTLEQAIQKIRPDNVEKREILLKTGRILRNFFPIITNIMRRS
jgi:8-oxo-dGTP pyrophosphatase MutT (NUDIX family)